MNDHMSVAEFTIYFDGEALRDGSMDVRDLAPAMLAFGDMLEQANRVLNGNEVKVSVRVKGFPAGSFGISFETILDFMSQLKGVFQPGSTFRDALEILNLLGISPTALTTGSCAGLFALIKWARGRKLTKTATLEHNRVALSFEDDTIEVQKSVADLYTDPVVRNCLDRAVEPLRTQGISSIYVKDDGNKFQLINAKDVSYFSPVDLDERMPLDVDEAPQIRYFSIVSLSFKEDNKWKLTDGTSQIFVTISDKKFLADVDSGIKSFSKGDRLKVRLVTRQAQTRKGLVTDYEAVEVLEHTSPHRQYSLPM